MKTDTVKTKKQNEYNEKRIQGEAHGLFIVNKANNDIAKAKNMPNPKMLFSEFWHEGELCVLYGEAATGKSALAVQIANSITRGRPIRDFKMTAKSQKVLYCDFELSNKQFENRYSTGFKNHYRFHDRLFRLSLLQGAVLPRSRKFVQYAIESLEQHIINKKIKVVIIDNITFLNNTSSAKQTGNLMGNLKSLKENYGLSLLVLAHTTKRRGNQPLTINDIMGSSMTGNFMDSSFAIGKSSGQADIRYLKQIKERMTEKIYGENNVCVCRLSQEKNFLKFHFVEYGDEEQHLTKGFIIKNDTELKQEITQRHSQGMSLREIADDLNINHMKVSRVLKKLNAS